MSLHLVRRHSTQLNKELISLHINSIAAWTAVFVWLESESDNLQQKWSKISGLAPHLYTQRDLYTTTALDPATWLPYLKANQRKMCNGLTSAPIFHHPDPSKSIILDMDASDVRIGAILSQRHDDPAKLHPCTFYSLKLSPAEFNVGDKQMLSIKSTLEEWRHMLEGGKYTFIVPTDHKNLKYIWTATSLNPCQWSLFFTRFNFSVTYQHGSKNSQADTLSHIYEKAQVNLSNS